MDWLGLMMERTLSKILPDFWKEQLENVWGREKGMNDLEFSLDMLNLGAFKTCKKSQISHEMERSREDCSQGAGGAGEAGEQRHIEPSRRRAMVTMSHTFERSS